MRIWRFLLLWALLLSSVAVLRSGAAETSNDSSFNPESVLLSHFTLTRPQSWQWVSTGPHEGSILMEVIFTAKESGNQTGPVMIYFNHTKPKADIATRAATAKRWRSWFADVRSYTPFSAQKTIGDNKLSLVEMIGTYQGPVAPGKSPRLQQNLTLYGAHIEDNEGDILVRMVGPVDAVQKNKSAFTAMLKQMLQQP